MKKPGKTPTVERKKVVAILMLSIMTVIIILFGIAFSIYSMVNNIYFTVLNSEISGAVFGALSIFLGVRYFLSVQKLKSEVYKTTSKFSWSNFKKAKKQF